MAPRSSWKGFVRLSLVSVPVKAYTASATGGEIRLNQLHKETKQRIKYQKVVPDKGPVPNDEIVSGYEYAKGQYVIVDPDELDKLRKKSDRSINIDGFIPADTVDPVYQTGRTYYLLPDGAVGQKPYQLLQKAMADRDICAIAQVVIAGREQLVVLRTIDRFLAMSILQHQSKIKPVDAFHDEIVEAGYTSEEMRLTETLIDASMIDEFDFGKYTDGYVEKLTKLIQMKVDGEEIVQVKDSEEPQVINFMQALKQSVAEAQSAVAGERKKKMAPSSKKTAKKASKKKSG